VGVVAHTLITATPISGLSPEKAAMEQDRDTYQRALATTVVLLHLTPITEAIEPTLPPRTPLPGPPRRVAGAGLIIEDPRCGVNTKELSSRNLWRETNGPLLTGVCAGSSYFKPYHGQILFEVYDTAAGRHVEGPAIYEVPAPVQWVKVVDAVGERVILEADTGVHFAFDVPTRQWVTLDGTPLPTQSPTPSPSPLAAQSPLPSPSLGPSPPPSPPP